MKKFVLVAVGALSVVIGAGAASSSWTPQGPAAAGVQNSAPLGEAEKYFEHGKQSLENGNFAEAEKNFRASDRAAPNQPDTLNLLAFSLRKQGKLNDAFAYYGRALRLRPKFPEAREYLGEAHLQAALQQIQILKSYGPAGQEALRQLSDAFREAAARAR